MAHRLVAKGGLDLEALSPRDANAQRMPKAIEMKTSKPVAQLKAAKDKEPPPVPPASIDEPPANDRPNGAVYQVGRMLGKGGFAVCYQGYLLPERKKYALKIVRSQMPSKMMQKVSPIAGLFSFPGSSLTRPAVPNRTPDPLEDEPEEHCPVLQSVLLS